MLQFSISAWNFSAQNSTIFSTQYMRLHCCSFVSSVGGLKTFKVHLTKHRKRGSAALAKLCSLNGWPFLFENFRPVSRCGGGVIHYKNWSEKNICSEKSVSEKSLKNAVLLLLRFAYYRLHNKRSWGVKRISLFTLFLTQNFMNINGRTLLFS